jgi:hypothetical protein
MADHHDLAPVPVHLGNLVMNLRDQRAGGVEHAQAPRVRFRTHRLRHAVRGEHDRCAARHFRELLDEVRTLRLEVVDDELVVHDLVADVDRRAELRERLLDDGNGAVDTCTEAARVGEQDVHLPSVPKGRPEGLTAPPPGAATPNVSEASVGVHFFSLRKLSMMSIAAPTVIALSATLNAGHDQPP